MKTYNGERVQFVPVAFEAQARAEAPWAKVVRQGVKGYWCAESEKALQAALGTQP